MARFCPNCGTEVDDAAVFCPTCGQAIDQATELEMPPAPAWPEPAPRAEPPVPPPARDESVEPLEPAWQTVPRRPEHPTPAPAPPPAAPEPPTAWTERPAPDAPPPPPASDRPQVDLPITMPVTLSSWLIGGGSALGAVGGLLSLFTGSLNPIELLLFIALLGIAVTVFLSANVPAIPHLRLVTMAVVFIGFGVALGRLAFGAAGAGELLLFLGTAAAAMGAVILELGRDQPMGGTS